MSLRVYNRKRKFSETPEPPGKVKKSKGGQARFVVQLHHASRIHYDFRLEFGGSLKSWAVPKGPSLNPQDQRLAVFVEDHPLDYGSFEGIIPKNNYGAGTVMLWDEGTYIERSSSTRKQSESAMLKGLKKGHLTFLLDGEKLKGEFALIKLKKGTDDKAWLLVKKRDEFSTYKRSDVLDQHSVKTGRSIEQIAKQSEATGDIWLSKRKNQKVAVPKVIVRPKSKPEVKRSKSRYEPMPRRIKPMVPTLSRHDVDAKQWIIHPVLDGLRAIAEIEGKRIHFYSKSGLPFEKKFPKIVSDLKSLKSNCVLDGEIVQTKKEDFYYPYDILYVDGKDLRKASLRERLSVLSSVLKPTGHLRELPDVKKTAPDFVAKNPNSPYRSGTSSDWLIVQASAQKTNTLKAKPREIPKPKKMGFKKLLKSTRQPLVSRDEARLTHPDKIFWPQEKITKGDLFNYYKEVAPFLVPYLKDRPESLNRFPNGIDKPSFYQKDMTGYTPRWFKTARIESESAGKTIDYALVQDERSLLYIVNLGCIEINPWFSRVGHLENPDFVVIDLDPDDNDFSEVIKVAHEVHKTLDAIGAANFCKTSGATGIHIGIPTGARYHFDEVRAFTENVCKVVNKKFPAITSVERNPNRRRGKIYLDFMQNRRGQTLAAPFCVRPKPGAPVSMPVTWKELTPKLRPEQFHIGNALNRIRKIKDPWKPVLSDPINLLKCVTALARKFKKD